jgi:hypothetical protein
MGADAGQADLRASARPCAIEALWGVVGGGRFRYNNETAARRGPEIRPRPGIV